MLDLTDTKYRDFDVSLDSSYCLPSIRTSVLKRSPTPPLPRTKQKTVTFALPSEEVDDEPLEILEAPEEVIAPVPWKEMDELEDYKFPFEPGRDDESSSSVDRFPIPGPQLHKLHAILPSPTFSPQVGKAAVTRPDSFSPAAFKRNRSRPSDATLPMPKHRHGARNALLLPAMVEPTAQGSYLDSIMAVRSHNLAGFYLGRSTTFLSRF